MSLRERCDAPDCGLAAGKGGFYCAPHQRQIPDDLRSRLAWARRYGDESDREAAREAIKEYFDG
jgi:hypothetical protein